MHKDDVRMWWDQGTLWMSIVGFDMAIPMDAKIAEQVMLKLRDQQRYISAQIIVDERDNEILERENRE